MLAATKVSGLVGSDIFSGPDRFDDGLVLIGNSFSEALFVHRNPLDELGTLHVTAIHGLYHEQAKALSTPDSVIMFQPGFTVPDYDWSDSLKCIRDGTPFLLTPSAEMEAVANIQYLLEQERNCHRGSWTCWKSRAKQRPTTLLAVNPFCGLRIR